MSWSGLRTLACMWLATIAWWCPVAEVRAHDTRPAYLEFVETAPNVFDVVWRVPIFSGRRLPITLQLPDGFERSVPPTGREYRDAVVERLTLRAPDGLVGRRVRFIGLEATITDVLVRAQTLDGTTITELVRPARPWIEIPAAVGPWSVAWDYLALGVEHILSGLDHLAFVLILCLLVRSPRTLFATITAFTIAHSITLAVSATGAVRLPMAPVEASIALSIILLAREALGHGPATSASRFPWAVAFGFGLLHGFGFASALIDAGLPVGDVSLALFSFNVGVELGQLAFIATLFIAYRASRGIVRQLASATLVKSGVAYTVGSLAAFWFFDRLAGIFS